MSTIEKIVKIAFLYRQERDSQKFACKNLDFIFDKIEFQVIPFNLDKYSNPNTIKKRLSEHDEVIVFEYDYDIREILNKLKIEYKIFIPTISEGFIDHWNYHSFRRTEKIFMKKIPFDFSNKMIIYTLLKTLNRNRIVTYYYIQNGIIKESKKSLEPNQEISDTDKSEVAKEYVKNLTKDIELTESILFKDRKKLKEFKEKYKELL